MTKLSFDTAKELINYLLPELTRKLKRIGYRLGAKLGEGYYGITYDLGSGRVLKITGDLSGAKIAAKLLKKNYKYIPKIFRVFQLKSVGVDLFFIEMEKLEPVSPLIKQAIRLLTEVVNYPETSLEYLKSRYLKKHPIAEYTPFESVKNYVSLFSFRDVERLNHLKTPLEGILEMLKYLENHHIFLGDLHEGNIMQKNGILKVADLGRTYLRGAL